MSNKLVIKVEVDAKDVARGVAVAKGQVQGLQKEIDKTDNASVKAAAAFGKYAAVAAGSFAAKAVKDQMELAKAIRTVQIESGATLQQASSLHAVLDVLGVPVESLSSAFRVLAANMQNSPEMFRELGIETRDAAGEARSAFAVFTDVRKVLADSSGDAATLAAAQALLGRGYQDLLPLLGATDEEMRALNEAAEISGIVMGETAVQGAEGLMDALNGVSNSVQGLAQNIAENLIPMLTQMAEAAAVGIDTLNALANTAHASASQGQFFVSGLANVLGGAWDAITGNPTEQLRQVNAQVNAQEKARAAIAAILQRQRSGLGTTRSGASLAGRLGSSAGADKAALDALRDLIDAIKDEAAERERAMRKALDAFEEERDAAISMIEAEGEARQRQHDLALRAIEDETRAREDAFETVDRARSDEIDALREQIRGTQELTDMERTRADLAAAEGDAEAERKVEIFRGAGQSANDYGRAVRDQQRRIGDADKRVADAKQKLEQDTARVAIEARVRAIEQEREGQRRALDDYRTGAEERLRALRDQMDEERRQSDARVEQIQTEIDVERKRAADEIDHLEEATRVTVSELEVQVKAHQSAASAVGAAWDAAARPRTISITTTGGDTGGETVTGGGGQDMNQRRGEQSGGGLTLHEARALKEELLGRPVSIEEAIGYVGRTRASVAAEIMASEEYRNRTAAPGGDGTTGVWLPGGQGDPHGSHDYPHTVTFSKPAMIVGADGTNYGMIAKTGAEDVSFGGVGRRGAGGDSVNVNAYGIGVAEAARLIARENERMLARRASHGYGRRR